jgi:hypothetical protein
MIIKQRKTGNWQGVPFLPIGVNEQGKNERLLWLKKRIVKDGIIKLPIRGYKTTEGKTNPKLVEDSDYSVGLCASIEDMPDGADSVLESDHGEVLYEIHRDNED